MIEYITRHHDKVIGPLTEHIWLVLVTLVISLVIASCLTVLAMRSEKVSDLLNYIFSLVYSVPSLALFALLIPITGLGRTSAVIVLTLYNQYLLLRNFTTGLREADPVVCEAAKGIGMTDMQILTRIRIPLARKAIFAGIRLAIVSTVGIATIAASINAGGLGILLFEGLRTMNIPKILWGSVLSAGMAVLFNAVLKTVEEKM
jgi:osmoprotectant transport system permease protein